MFVRLMVLPNFIFVGRWFDTYIYHIVSHHIMALGTSRNHVHFPRRLASVSAFRHLTNRYRTAPSTVYVIPPTCPQSLRVPLFWHEKKRNNSTYNRCKIDESLCLAEARSLANLKNSSVSHLRLPYMHARRPRSAFGVEASAVC